MLKIKACLLVRSRNKVVVGEPAAGDKLKIVKILFLKFCTYSYLVF